MKWLFTDVPDVNTVCLGGHRGITMEVAVVTAEYGVAFSGVLRESAAKKQLKWLADG